VPVFTSRISVGGPSGIRLGSRNNLEQASRLTSTIAF
jgi:hypothetical protein